MEVQYLSVTSRSVVSTLEVYMSLWCMYIFVHCTILYWPTGLDWLWLWLCGSGCLALAYLMATLVNVVSVSHLGVVASNVLSLNII